MTTDSAPNAPHKTAKRRTDAEIIAALKATGGLVYLAARQLGCDHTVIYRRREKSPAVAAVIEAQRGELVDMAEAGLKKQVLLGNVTAMIWITKTLGKGRGYVERQEVAIEHSRIDDEIERGMAQLAARSKASDAGADRGAIGGHADTTPAVESASEPTVAD